MELGLHRVWHGLRLIKRSVELVIANPVLLVYGICSFVISYCLNLIFFHVKENLLLGSYEASAQVISDVYARIGFCSWILTSVSTCFTFFFLACLAHHVMHILQHDLNTVKESFAGVMRRWAPLTLWILFQISMRFFGSIIKALVFLPSYAKYSIAVQLWVIIVCLVSYLTSLVLPIIATEQTGIIVAIKRSCGLVYRFFMQLIGVFLVFSLAQIVAYTYMESTALLVVVKHLEVLTYTIFYYEYYARPKPELAELFYPDV